MNNFDKWMNVYEKNLKKAVETKTNYYNWPVENVPQVAQKMGEAFKLGSYSKDGFAVKWTCKELGLKHTYTAINEFLKI